MDLSSLEAKIKGASKEELTKMLEELHESYRHLSSQVSISGYDLIGSFVVDRPLWQHPHPPMGKAGYQDQLNRLRAVGLAIHRQMKVLDPSHVIPSE